MKKVFIFKVTALIIVLSSIGTILWALPRCKESPAAPTGLNTTAFPDLIVLRWTDNVKVDNVNKPEGGYYLQRCLQTDSGRTEWETINMLASCSTVTVDASPVSGAITMYRVAAFNHCGLSEWSNDCSVFCP